MVEAATFAATAADIGGDRPPCPSVMFLRSGFLGDCRDVKNEGLEWILTMMNSLCLQ